MPGVDEGPLENIAGKATVIAGKDTVIAGKGKDKRAPGHNGRARRIPVKARDALKLREIQVLSA